MVFKVVMTPVSTKTIGDLIKSEMERQVAIQKAPDSFNVPTDDLDEVRRMLRECESIDTGREFEIVEELL